MIAIRNALILANRASNRWEFMLIGLVAEMYKKNEFRQIGAFRMLAFVLAFVLALAIL